VKLSIELVPKPAHFQNARAALRRAAWNRVKDATTERAGHTCEICGDDSRLEAHELWDWQELSETDGCQLLVRTLALCPWCHRAKHWGFTEGTEFIAGTRRHILRVNGWSDAELDEHVRATWREWARLSKLVWAMDISVLDPWVARPANRPRSKKPAEHAPGGLDI
jgi:hypothetical protein